MGGVEDDRRLVRQGLLRRGRRTTSSTTCMAVARRRSTPRRCSTCARSPTVLHLPHDAGLDTAVQPRGFRLLHKIPRLPEHRRRPRGRAVRAPAEDHARRRAGPRRGRRRRRSPRPGDQGRSRPPGRDVDPRALRLTALRFGRWLQLVGRARVRRPRSSASRLRGDGGEPVEAIHARPDGPADARGWCCIPTSWGCARCSTTCAAGSRRTASRCARPSRSRTSATATSSTPPARMDTGEGPRRLARSSATSSAPPTASSCTTTSPTSRSSGSAWAGCTR